MEKLPENIENKIFYYLEHPITEALKRKKVVLLKPRDNPIIDRFFLGTTMIVFSPEKIGLEKRVKEQGLYKMHLSPRVFFNETVNKIFNEARPCYASPAYLIHHKLRKHLKDKLMIEKNKKEIERLMHNFHIKTERRIELCRQKVYDIPYRYKYRFEVSDDVNNSEMGRTNSYLDVAVFIKFNKVSIALHEITEKRVF